MTGERRAFRRYAVRAGEIQALFHPGPEFHSVKNIGKGGLAISYTPVPGEALQARTVDLISQVGDPLVLKVIACRTVYDIETLMEGQSFRGRPRKLLGLKFLALTSAQEAQLETLIARCFHGPTGGTGARDDTPDA